MWFAISKNFIGVCIFYITTYPVSQKNHKQNESGSWLRKMFKKVWINILLYVTKQYYNKLILEK